VARTCTYQQQHREIPLNATELIALADAHGIDFVAVAGNANRPDGVAGKRRKTWITLDPGVTDESRKKILIEAPDSAKGKGSRVAKPAAYSHAELGVAAAGVKGLYWAAAQHTIANDRTPLTIRTLMCGLRYHANKIATDENWEATVPAMRAAVKRDPKTKVVIAAEARQEVLYLEPLCMLVIDEVSFRPAFTAAPELFAIYLGIEEVTWESRLEERFRLLQAKYAQWYGSGLGMIQRRINGDPDEERVA
jgi:hypothetical protein